MPNTAIPQGQRPSGEVRKNEPAFLKRPYVDQTALKLDTQDQGSVEKQMNQKYLHASGASSRTGGISMNQGCQ